MGVAGYVKTACNEEKKKHKLIFVLYFGNSELELFSQKEKSTFTIQYD